MRLIYVIHNLVNGKTYVGQTKNLEQRKAGHLYSMRKDVDRPLYRSMRKHGIENFTFKILEECDDSLINDREQHWVAHFDSFNPEKGYNLTRGGNQHFEHTVQTRQKISHIRRGQKLGPRSSETKEKISQSHRGKRLSEEHRQKLSMSARGNTNSRGKQRSEATKKKISESQLSPNNPRRGSKRSEETRRKMREAWVRRRVAKVLTTRDT